MQPSGSSPLLAGGEATTYLSLGDEWTLRNPPRLAVKLPLPCDLAHTISVEFEGIPERFTAAAYSSAGRGCPERTLRKEAAVVQHFTLGPVAPMPSGVIERPGLRRMRVWLEPALDRGWADPEIRSIWPGRIATEWVEVEIVRR